MHFLPIIEPLNLPKLSAKSLEGVCFILKYAHFRQQGSLCNSP